MGVEEHVVVVQEEVPAGGKLTLDVSDAVGLGERLYVSASVHRPAGSPRAALVCWPGGSYACAYWDMHIPGHSGYSLAEHLTMLDYLVVAADYLGVGASSRPAKGDRVDSVTVAAAAASFVDQLRHLVAEGAPYDAVARCWASRTGTRTSRSVQSAPPRPTTRIPSPCDRPPSSRHGRSSARRGTTCTARPPREPHHAWLHRPDVPAAVIAADDAVASPWPRQLYVDGPLAGYSAGFDAEVDLTSSSASATTTSRRSSTPTSRSIHAAATSPCTSCTPRHIAKTSPARARCSGTGSPAGPPGCPAREVSDR